MSSTEFNMDLDWRFKILNEDKKIIKDHSGVYISNKSGVLAGIPGKEYADNDWEKISLPHDYYVGIGFDENNIKPQGYHNHSDAWYRKTFLLDPKAKGKAYNLVFEGIAGKAKVYFNGFFLGETKSTYCEYAFDITDYVYNDERLNVLAVNIDGNSFEGWWYEGAGIYRHVKLFEKELIHITHNSLFAKPVIKENTENDWNVEISLEVENSGYEANSKVYATAELIFGEQILSMCKTTSAIAECGEKISLEGGLTVDNPNRWDIDLPNLYEVKVTLWQDEKILDMQSAKIGFRTISVDPNHGFYLNGKKVFIKGTCNHQDHAGVGVALSDSLHKWRIKRLKEMGSNAYRCAHNLHSKEILDACDELGMLVMDENRHFQCDPETLWQVENMVRRDRNHPSVVFWSLFNEEPLQSTEEGARIFKKMKQKVLKYDDSRLITGGVNGALEGTAFEMDIAGLNYFVHQADIAREKYPNMTIIGSENHSATTTRGCYKSDLTNHVLNNYDEEVVPAGSTIRKMWDFARQREFFAGFFVWTGFDYRGEPTPFEWPSVSSQFGVLDTCGFEKDAFYYHKACFTEKPMVHLLPHWTWKKGDKVRVVAVTNCDEAELFLNGKSLGKKIADVCEPPEWMVDFESGEILVKAYNKGVVVAEDRQVTAGKPYKIKLFLNNETINNSGQDMILVNAAIVDENNVLVPDADNLITFEVDGDGIIKGTGNGNPNSHEDDTKPYRLAFHGLCQAVVMAKENAKKVKVIAGSENLKSAEIEIPVVSIPKPNFMPSVLGSNVGGFTISDIFEDRPDPLMEISDNDMNTFTPFIVPPMGYQRDFHLGWRIYRTKQTLLKGSGEYELRFPAIKGDVIEVYLNGELKAKESYPSGDEIVISFNGEDNEEIEIRSLIFANNDFHGCGISEFVTLKKK